MPHLAPLFWLLMPLLIASMIYTQMMLFYFHQPSSFPLIKLNTYKMSDWKW
uniref:ATP synthase F0 subunit 8 n=1 Tax=Syllis sp. JYC-2022 TaxID=2928755 RepID=A0A976X6J5_9ANNE|nr:ATP synthase F0 subunit 8 [Syllis sp. JYC-2022]